MDIEEMMIDYILNRAMPGEVEEFFGYADYGVCTRETCPFPRCRKEMVNNGRIHNG